MDISSQLLRRQIQRVVMRLIEIKIIFGRARGSSQLAYGPLGPAEIDSSYRCRYERVTEDWQERVAVDDKLYW